MDVDPDEPEFLSVRETARRLDVHENTVRNWARDGILPTARIPGSRFHRFDARDVERLQRQRGAGVSSVEEERRTVGPELVDGTQLSHWAMTRDAQGKFPELLRRLLASTPGVANVSVRAGDGVAAAGWDGHAESTGTAYLPAGSLCFEFGVGGNPQKKAQEDWDKRCKDPLGVMPRECIFVFVTPRRWPSSDTWATARRAEKIFADVRVLDADDLEGWLQAAPAVHHWISEHLGRRPQEAETLERWWTRFRTQTDPALPSALFLAGRDPARAQFVEFLGGRPGSIAIQTDWHKEAIAFVYAAIETITAEISNIVAQALIVRSADVWNRIVTQPGRMILLPLFESPDVAAAQEHGHHVVFPLGRDQVVRGNAITLPRPHRQGAGDALQAEGISSDQAYELAALARRSMPALVRRLARDMRVARPDWSRPPDVEILAPLVLAGSWTAAESDRNAVSQLADKEWSTIERTLLRWRDTEDRPFVQSGTQWHLASPKEAFLLLRDALTPTDLERWHQLVQDMLLETNPVHDLPIDERPMAGAMGIARAYSRVLRRGIAEGVALVGSATDKQLNDGVTGAEHAQRIVREILKQARGDLSGVTWQSLEDVLPLLAEAAPQDFLDAVHDDLDRDKPALTTMFQDGDQSSWLYSASPHTGLLWALEGLCWSSDYVLDATRALARLQVIDPGGKLANRPLGSLHSVLVGWVRHTSAPFQLKVKAVEQICNRMPDVGWRLVLALWPSPHSVVSPPAAPSFRDWCPDDRNVPLSEWVNYIGHLVRVAIDLTQLEPKRWIELVAHIGSLPTPERGRLIDALDAAVSSDSPDAAHRLQLWESLHKEVSQHKRFSSAQWAMDEEPLLYLQAIADRLEPQEDVQRFGYLFDWRPTIPEIDPHDHAAYEKRLHELRTLAVTETIGDGSIDALRQLAERSPVPTHLGWIVGEIASEDLTSKLVEWLDCEEPKLREVAEGWARRKLSDRNIQWFRESLARPEMTRPRSIAFVRNAPPHPDIWDTLMEIDADLNAAYWKDLQAWSVSPEDVERAVRQLLLNDRPWVAIDILVTSTHSKPDAKGSITPDLVMDVLNSAMTSDPNEARAQSVQYEVGQLLDFLEATAVSQEVIARYEFAFFPLLDHYRQPRALHANLSNDSGLFVEMVSRVYRGKNQPRRQLSEGEQAVTHRAWGILRHWRGLPGLNATSGVLDVDHLNQWIRQARLAFADSDRADIGDEQIGQVLSAAPAGDDGIWPIEPVREIIETVGSRSIEAGIHVGVINARGVTSRGVYDGGEQERTLARQYREWAKQTAGAWPRTSRLLRGIAESYERDAQREDAEAQINADTR